MRRNAKLALHDVEGILGLTLARGEAETPIRDLQAAAPPVVGVTEDHRAGQTGAESQFDLPGEEFAFVGFAFPKGVHAEFAEDERFGSGERLQPGEVAGK